MRHALPLALAALAALSVPATAQAMQACVIIDEEPASCFDTISAAVNAAPSNGIVELDPGVWEGAVDLNNDQVTLRGREGPEATTLRHSSGHVVRIRNNNSVITLQGLTIESLSTGSHQAVRIENAPTVTLRNVVVQGAAGNGDGNALYLNDGTLLVEDSVFRDNKGASGKKGPINLDDGDATFRRTRFEHNEGYRGGAIYIHKALDVVFEDCVFEGNMVLGGNDGGAIRGHNNARLVFEDTDFLGNVSSGSGGAIFLSDGSLDIEGGLFEGNGANGANGGGAIRVTGKPDITVQGATFRGNLATAGSGGALRLHEPKTLVLTDNRFLYNVAVDDGGAVVVEDTDSAHVLGTHNTFCANQAGGSGAGGAVALMQGATSATWLNNVFTDNEAGQGGALYLKDPTTTLQNNTFAGNHASSAGGALYYDASGRVLLFTNNLVAWTGGDGVHLAAAGAASALTYNAFYENVENDVVGSLLSETDSNLYGAHPTLKAFAPGMPCDEQLLHPLYGSPLIEAGDPTLLNPDGSRSDIGAFGGPGADPLLWVDVDGDGVKAVHDCDDNDPNNWVSCDTCVDEDGDDWYVGCDDYVTILGPDCDDTDPLATETTTWWLDCDGDGWFGETEILSCSAPTLDNFDAELNPGVPWPCYIDATPVNPVGTATTDLDPDTYTFDCDDNDIYTWPGAPELCNGKDNNCSGIADDGAVDLPWYPDLDGDGFGDMFAPPVLDCNLVPGHVLDNTDCDDTDPTVYPGAPEDCNGIDNNCNGTPDHPPPDDAPLWWPDLDDDGYGDMLAEPVASCTAPEDHVDNDLDCDDTDPTVYPGAPEYCNGIDNSCNGIPDDPDPVDAPAWWPDADGDGFGDMHADPVHACEQPEGHVDNDLDCDDSDPNVFPGAAEPENDCDQLVDTGDGPGPVAPGFRYGGGGACGCDGGGGAATPFALLLALTGLALGRRRPRPI